MMTKLQNTNNISKYSIKKKGKDKWESFKAILNNKMEIQENKNRIFYQMSKYINK